MRRSTIIVVMLLVGIVLAQPALSQRITATIRGTVTDDTGGVLPGVTVTANNPATGVTRTVITNAAGAYIFGDLVVGSYELKAELEGFKAAIVTGIALNVADTREIDFKLELGAITEEITSVSPAIVVETIGGEVAGLITGEQVRELPLNGRNFLQLTQLMPGVAALDNFNVKNKGLLTGSDLSVSGGRVTSNLWMVDGANNNDVGSNRTILVYPSVEAIEEFKIHRNAYGAEFGGAGGAQVNLVTRAGTNQLKGSVFYFRRDDSWNEANYILRQAGADKEKLDRNDYGYTLGGALKKDKLHFFLSQEWNDEERGLARSAFVPTAAEKLGDFSQSNPDCSPFPIDPLTGQPFPGNVIPTDRLSEAGLLFMQLYPDANTSLAGTCTNWVDSIDAPIDWDQINARLDWNVNDRTRVMLRYTEDGWDNPGPSAGAENGLWGDDAFPAADSAWAQPSESLVAQLNQVIGSSALNTVTFSMSGNEIKINQVGNLDLIQGVNEAIPTFFSDKTSGENASHPVFWGSGGYPVLWNIAPWQNDQDLMAFKDDYEQVFGNHVFKAGVLYSENKKVEVAGGGAHNEAAHFWGPGAGISPWGFNATGNTVADFLLEGMYFGFDEPSFNPVPDIRWEDLEVYVADSWQVLPNLTLDYGIRYSRFYEPYNKDRSVYVSFNPDRFNPALGGDPCNGIMQVPGNDPCGEAGFLGASTGPNKALINGDTDNFAPRLGLAWDVFKTGNSVVRVGFGQFFQRERVSPQLNFLSNPPLVQFASGIRTLDGTQIFTDPLGAGRPNVGFDVNGDTPYNLQYNVTWEQRLWTDTTVEVSYVGSRGRHLLRSNDINQVPSGDSNGNGIADRLEYVRCGPDDSGCRAALRPFGVFGDVDILYWTTDGNSEYDSLQTQLISRFGRGSQFQASYTYSNFDADTGVGGSSGGFDGEETTTDLFNRRLDWGPAELHRDHVFNASLIYNLPTFEGQGGFKEHLLGNWSLGLIAIYASGTPITIFAADPGGDLGGEAAAGLGYEGSTRPIRTGASCSGAGGTQVLNPDAFTLTGFRLGDASQMAERGACEGPDYQQIDLSFYKNVPFGDRFNLQLRIEIFNIFNQNNLVGQSVARDWNGPVTLDAPRGQASVVTSSEPPPNFGVATAARDPRQVQLGLKFTF